VGSSKNIANRLSIYYSRKTMLNKVNSRTSIIYSALLKHGYDNFSLDILEYCGIDILIEREQYYLDLLKPEYNILKAANSRMGSKHSLKTRALMSVKLKGENHPIFGKTLSVETRRKISISLRSITRVNNKPRVISLETRLLKSLRCKGVALKVYDKWNNLINEFPTIKSASKHFDLSDRTIGRYLDKDKYYNGYKFISKDIK
jgi:group I intron endonuclease